jgi:hypothetical protein
LRTLIVFATASHGQLDLERRLGHHPRHYFQMKPQYLPMYLYHLIVVDYSDMKRFHPLNLQALGHAAFEHFHMQSIFSLRLDRSGASSHRISNEYSFANLF